jgi:hypothetical protein
MPLDWSNIQGRTRAIAGRPRSQVIMSTDPKTTNSATFPKASPSIEARHQGIKIFSYPKIVFLMPTMLAALICGIIMWASGDHTQDPRKAAHEAQAQTAKAAPASASAPAPGTPEGEAQPHPVRRFSTVQNVVGMIFLLIFFLNLVILSLDFPRFTVIALVLLFATLGFFLLWLNVYFELLPPLVNLLESMYAVANKGFYFLIATVILLNMAFIWVSRYLDYWEILPNEILHNHGPFSDLERYPTQNLKFDKEIPDILEYALLRSGRLVLHIPGQPKAIVLENVLWINHKEEYLKKLMSRMEVVSGSIGP